MHVAPGRSLLAAPGHGRAVLAAAAAVAFPLLLAGCGPAAPAGTPPITPGTGATPRAVNIVARDYGYVPSVVDLVPGETVVLRVVNGGLMVHEVIVGSMETQLAWEAAEAPFADPPPGPTPIVADPPGFDGVRVVVGSGERMDVTWTVPSNAAATPGGWFVGCHIPGHWEKGMVVPVRFVDAGGRPLPTSSPLALAVASPGPTLPQAPSPSSGAGG